MSSVSNIEEKCPKGETIGVWLPHEKGDLHIYVFNKTHEGTGVAVGCNRENSAELRGSNPALVIKSDGSALVQYFEGSQVRIKDIPQASVKMALEKFLLELTLVAKA